MSSASSKAPPPSPNKLSSESLVAMAESMGEDDALRFLASERPWLHNGSEIFAATQAKKSRLVRELAIRITSQRSLKKNSLDWRSESGLTALAVAASQGPSGTDSLLALLEHGADPSALQKKAPASFWRGALRQTARGLSVMDFAASSNACESIAALARKAPQLVLAAGLGGMLPLAHAARKGNVGAIRVLTREGSAWAMDDAGLSAVAHACAAGHPEALAELLAHDPGAMPEWLSAPFERSPMALAISEGRSTRCVDVLIAHASRFHRISAEILQAYDPSADTGLALAAACGATRIFDALLEPTLAAARSDEMRIAVLKRCVEPSSEFCKAASASCSEIDHGGKSAIAHAVRIAAKVPKPPARDYPWHPGFGRGPSPEEAKSTRYFLSGMAHCLRSGSSGKELSASVAAFMASTPASVLSQACGQRMAAGAGTLLHALAARGLVEEFDSVWKLAGSSAIFELDNHGWTPFFVAAAHGHAELCSFVMKRLGKRRDPIEELEDIHGRSPLLVAIERGHLGVASVLLSESSRGAAILGRACSLVGKTPLMAACAGGNESLVETLVQLAGLGPPDFAATDLWGNTPLHAAVAARRPKGVAASASRSNPNRANAMGESPLHLACQLGFVEAIALLSPLAKGSVYPDHSGLGPVDICALREHGPEALAIVAQWVDPRIPVIPTPCHGVSGLASSARNAAALARLVGREEAADVLDAISLGWKSGIYPPKLAIPVEPAAAAAAADGFEAAVLGKSSPPAASSLKEAARIARLRMGLAASLEAPPARKSTISRSSAQKIR